MTDLETVRLRVERRVVLRGESLERLMVDWLGELLYLHDVENLLFRRFSIEFVGEDGLKGVAKGEPFQEGIHEIKREVKAITYHQLRIERQGEGWRAQVIFDL